MTEALVIIPDYEIDARDRLAGKLAGDWGESVAHASGEPDSVQGEHEKIGFVPPEIRRQQRLFDEIRSFLRQLSQDEIPG